MKLSEYQNHFSNSKREKALDRAWKNRDFEIELYWKRATYFWTFLVATFAGYFVVISRPEVQKIFPQAPLFVACLGFIFAFSWCLVNIGSKRWQENWERHIDMLEDEITGPIYKIVLVKNGFSVSKINLWVSKFVTVMWLLLAILYFFNSVNCSSSSYFDYPAIVIAIVTALFAFLIFASGGKRFFFKDKEIKKVTFEMRRFEYFEVEDDKL